MYRLIRENKKKGILFKGIAGRELRGSRDKVTPEFNVILTLIISLVIKV